MFEPLFRAEHIGSLLRPVTLKKAFQALQNGNINPVDYRSVLDSEIERVVKLQESVGLQSITDGEFGRSSWFGFFFERMNGFQLKPSYFSFHDGAGNEYKWPTCCAVAPMERSAPICINEFEKLRRLTNHTPKASIPSPTAFHFFRGDECRDQSVYPDMDQWWLDLISIYQSEIKDLYAVGCRNLQIDEVPVAMMCDPDVRDMLGSMGYEPDKLLKKYMAVINEILQVCPIDMHVGMHLCRGNFRSRWMAAGGYDPIAPRWFNGIDVNTFFLEYDSERAGSFEPLRYVGANKSVVLGLISSKTAKLEDQDLLRRRIDEAASFVPYERLALSPQCGFASVAGGNSLTEDEQMAKLGLVFNVAQSVWKTP